MFFSIGENICSLSVLSASFKFPGINTAVAEGEYSFAADAAWTVSGSVNHFGHTHYRRNYYHAMVTLVTDKGSWKIKDIELIDEKRLL